MTVNPNSDLWYLWEAFWITFLVLAIEVLITLRGNRLQRRDRGRAQKRATHAFEDHAS
jgi:heme exporter protein D